MRSLGDDRPDPRRRRSVWPGKYDSGFRSANHGPTVMGSGSQTVPEGRLEFPEPGHEVFAVMRRSGPSECEAGRSELARRDTGCGALARDRCAHQGGWIRALADARAFSAGAWLCQPAAVRSAASCAVVKRWASNRDCPTDACVRECRSGSQRQIHLTPPCTCQSIDPSFIAVSHDPVRLGRSLLGRASVCRRYLLVAA